MARLPTGLFERTRQLGLDRGWQQHRWRLIQCRRFDLQGIVRQAEQAFAGLDYLLQVEVGLFTHFGRRHIAPHLHGLVFGDLPRRQRLGSCFAGGVAGAPALEVRKVWGLAGACRYLAKPPLGVATYYRSAKGQSFAPVRQLTLPERYFLWQQLGGFSYPDLVVAGGQGRGVVAAALAEIDQLVDRA